MQKWMVLFLFMVCLFMVAPAVYADNGEVTLPVVPGGEKGYFRISSTPSFADVYFDGEYVGETTVTVTVSTTGAPSHTIGIRLPGYEPWSTTIDRNPLPGETININADLVPSASTGIIMVQSSPSGATAVLDRGVSQTTPANFPNVPVGTHEITVYLSGYSTYYTSVDVGRGKTTVVSAQLSPVINTGALSASSVPSGAAVYVDGTYRGVTSTTIGNLASGQHTVKLTRAGYQDWTGQVSIQAGVATPLSVSLTPDPKPVYGTVSIFSYPSGADVYADGVYVGRTRSDSPMVFTEVTPGYHELLLSKTGYQDYSTSGVVTAGQDLDLTITLTPNPQPPSTGGVAISSSPTGADVYLDNAYVGLTPITRDTVTPGVHSVLLRISGYQDWQSQVQVTAGQTTQISATLMPVPTPTQSGSFPLAILGALALVLALVRKKVA